MGKRPRDDSPAWWATLKDEIEAQGGHLHPNLTFSETNRELYIAENSVDVGTLVMKIPSSNLISKDMAMKISPTLKCMLVELDGSKFFSSLIDLVIALALAVSHDTAIIYLSTLPESTSFDALPRRWPDGQLETLLKGSPLLRRVLRSKKGIQEDFQRLKTAWEKHYVESDTCNFPSFDKFSDMLAAVSSRAFALDENDSENVSLIPVLDLCDHCRGAGIKKNLSYQYNQSDNVVEVRAVQRIEANEGLRLTYGAQGNPQLLMNYGFTIPNNMEPDGSSNDVLEFSMDSDETTLVNLRTGPKSYTYACLVNALEQANTNETTTSNREDHDDDDDDDDDDSFDAFMHDEDDADGMDLYGDSADGGETDSDQEELIRSELAALTRFQEALTNRTKQYNLKGDTEAGKPNTREYCCATLIKSERRTMSLYSLAAKKIVALLQGTAGPSRDGLSLGSSDEELIETQAEELALAFMKIRHAELN